MAQPAVHSQELDRAAQVAAAASLAARLAASAPEGGHSQRRRRARLARLVADPAAMAVVLDLTDQVLRIRSPERAASRFASVVGAAMAPGGGGAAFAPADRLALRAGALVAPLLPRIVMPLVQRRVRAETEGLVIPAEDGAFTEHVRRCAAAGMQLNVNVLGEAILGEAEAARRLEKVRSYLARPDVDYVSVKLSGVSSRLNPAAFDDTVRDLVARLEPLYADAAAATPPKFVNLDMEEYRDLGLTSAVFTALLDQPHLQRLDAGIVLQAYLPDSHEALAHLGAWSLARRSGGGGLVKVRLVKGANLAMERVDAELHGWPLATYASKEEVDASYKQLLATALDPAWAGCLRVGVASHNLFDVAWALVSAEAAGAAGRVDIEMLQGMAPEAAEAVRDLLGAVLLYTPVVAAADFEAAIAYLARRLEENTTEGNFLRSVFDLDPSAPAWQAERARFEAAVDASPFVDTAPRRRQDRQVPPPPVPAPRTPADFENAPDTDLALPANRRWLARALAEGPAGLPSSVVPTGVPRAAAVTGTPHPTVVAPNPNHDGAVAYHWRPAAPHEVDAAVAGALAASAGWSARPGAERAAVLGRYADALEAARGRLVAAMVHDTGKLAPEADTEVSEAVDFARWYAAAIAELEELTSPGSGVAFSPYRVVVVASPWNFPVAIAAGGVTAALAVGAAVILKPAPEAVRCGHLLAEAAVAAGIPEGVLTFLPCADDDAGRALVAHEDVDAVVLTGSIETARLFASWRPGLRLHAETSGKNAILVTAAADHDAAVRDLVRSAFGHAGQKCSAASLAICEASVAADPRFLAQLADATSSLVVGPADDPRSTMGPLISPPGPDLERALTVLDPGEHWLVEPRCLDESRRLWSPGVRLGVAPGSFFHTTECFGPVLGVMAAPDLPTALAWQNATAFGLTAGLHSLDPDEIDLWCEGIEAGNTYVNRTTTGAIVGRQPFGGWKASSVGPTAKAGGPDQLLTLGRWSDVPTSEASAKGDPDEADGVAARRALDAGGWYRRRFGVEIDPAGLRAEANRWRDAPLPLVVVRAGAATPDLALVRACAAASAVGAGITVSSPVPRPTLLAEVVVEPADALAARLGAIAPTKLRLLEASSVLAAAAHAAGIDVDDNEVVGHGRIELTRWTREQVLSVTTHRYGNVAAAVRRPQVTRRC